MNENNLQNLLDQFEVADIFPVVDRYPADLITPLGAYLALSSGAPYSFLFESVEGGETLARYSFLGANPESVFKGTDDEPTLEGLRTRLEAGAIAEVSDLPSFAGGAVGFFEFSSSGEFEPILMRRGGSNGTSSHSLFMFFRTVVAFDHARQELMVVTLVFKKPGDSKILLEARLMEAGEANKTIANKINRVPVFGPLNEPLESHGGSTSNWTKPDFLEAVRKIKRMISSGEVYQVVLSQCFSKRTDAGPIPIYRALRSLNPSPYMFLLKTGRKSIVGASPEMLLRCRGRRLEYRPIAGTRSRHAEAIEDARLAQEMREDRKEVAEHTMLVDLGRNDLGRVAEYGTVTVNNLMRVEKFSHVQHLVTSLSAELAEGKERYDAFAACFPAGTVTGAPKIRAIETIYSLEPTRRGVYSGAVGYFDHAGNLDTCIAIRTLVLENGVARIQAGAGIVADSVPESEFEETVHKAAGLFRAIELAESGKYGK